MTKQRDLSGFYKYILNETTKDAEVKEEEDDKTKMYVFNLIKSPKSYSINFAM